MTDPELIDLIAQRAAQLYKRVSVKIAPGFIAHELWLVHHRIMPLRLDDMLAADDFNLAHDIGGIHEHLQVGNPSTLSNCFVPRFADQRRAS